MLNYFKLPLRFDPALLKADLQAILPDEWLPHFNARYYEGDWSGVALRSVGGAKGALYPDPVPQQPFADTAALARCANINQALAEFRCQLKSVRLLKLSAGSRIREHRDYQLGYEDGEVRLHVPITTNDAVEFYLNDERLVLGEGECWFLNFNLPHRVHNEGSDDRVHLVLDCVVNDWLKSMIPFESHASVESPQAPTPQREPERQSETHLSHEAVPHEPQGFEPFRQFVLRTPELQARLRETQGLKTFLALIVPLGAEHGYHFTATDVEEALRAARRAWLERWI